MSNDPCRSADAAVTNPSSPFMSAAEVAAYFGRTTRTLSNWERAGLLTARRMGRSKFYLRTEIEGFGITAPAPDQKAVSRAESGVGEVK